MNKYQNILNKVDHTLLKQGAKESDIKQLLDDAIKYNTAAVCVPPTYVKYCADYINKANSGVRVCTVIGFPNGYNTTAVKCFETEQAIQDGADEIDMVINIGWLKDKKYDEVLDEIKQIKAICGKRILKVIIETCLLEEEEKKMMCKLVTKAGANYIKTSTGFSTAGATVDDVKLLRYFVGKDVKVKAAGGISSLEDADEFIKLGADRLGTSRVIKIIKDRQNPDLD